MGNGNWLIAGEKAQLYPNKMLALYMCVKSNGRIKLTGKNQRTWRKTCPSATLSTTNPTWADINDNSYGNM
jgi:hypothetical protein